MHEQARLSYPAGLAAVVSNMAKLPRLQCSDLPRCATAIAACAPVVSSSPATNRSSVVLVCRLWAMLRCRVASRWPVVLWPLGLSRAYVVCSFYFYNNSGLSVIQLPCDCRLCVVAGAARNDRAASLGDTRCLSRAHSTQYQAAFFGSNSNGNRKQWRRRQRQQW